jgi:hypothetical protein
MKLVCALMLAAGSVLPADFQLVLTHGVCFGVCPAWTTTIDARGTLSYRGDGGRIPIGTSSRRMSSNDLKRLLDAVRDADFFGNPFADGRHTSADGSRDSLTIRMDGKERTFENYGYSIPSFDELKKRIDALTPIKCPGCIDERHAFIYDLYEGGASAGADVAEPAKRFARESLLLVMTSDGDQLRLLRNGEVRLHTNRLPFVEEIRATLPAKEMIAVTRLLPAMRRTRSNPQNLQKETWASFSVPAGERLPELIESPLHELPPLIEQLVDDRTYTAHATSIRVEVGPAANPDRARPWPAEDLVPLSQLTKRTCTAAEWSAIAARLEQQPPVGSDDAVSLRVIASAER